MVVRLDLRPTAVLRRAYPIIQGLNALGVLLGVAWYWPQFVRTPPLLLPFVPDCPLAAALLLVALALWRRGRGSALQGFAIGVALFYGAWTVTLLWRADAAGGFLDRLMLAAHVGMMLEAALLWVAALPSRGWRLAALWVAANTFVDYTLGTHPALPITASLPMVGVLTAAAAVVFALAAPAMEPSS